MVQKLDYHWHHTKTIQTACEVLAVAWNLEGLLLIGLCVLLGVVQFTHSLLDSGSFKAGLHSDASNQAYT